MAGCGRQARHGPVGGDLIGPTPTDRGRNGPKKSRLAERQGGPLAAVIAGANVHAAKLLEATIEAIVVERPAPSDARPRHLCLDKGYDHPTGPRAAAEHGYVPHSRRIGAERPGAPHRQRHPARRWVGERTLAWLSPCRAILVRSDTHARNDLALLNLACALLWSRRHWQLTVLR